MILRSVPSDHAIALMHLHFDEPPAAHGLLD
jgi:hypothetical protein